MRLRRGVLGSRADSAQREGRMHFEKNQGGKEKKVGNYRTMANGSHFSHPRKARSWNVELL